MRTTNRLKASATCEALAGAGAVFGMLRFDGWQQIAFAFLAGLTLSIFTGFLYLARLIHDREIREWFARQQRVPPAYLYDWERDGS